MALDINIIIQLVFKGIALAMGIVSVVLRFFPKETNTKSHITLLGIGLTALTIASLQ